jgi:hypothetical protein
VQGVRNFFETLTYIKMSFEQWKAYEEAELDNILPELGIYGGTMTLKDVAEHMTMRSIRQRWRSPRRYTADSIKAQICNSQARFERVRRTARERTSGGTATKRQFTIKKTYVYGGEFPLNGHELDSLLATRAELEEYEKEAEEALEGEEPDILPTYVTTEKSFTPPEQLCLPIRKRNWVYGPHHIPQKRRKTTATVYDNTAKKIEFVLLTQNDFGTPKWPMYPARKLARDLSDY